ncbi:hypothetical protein O3Q52_17380 [Streptomyces sp. ActVer]|uniref:hypothetical protein n=1 Tax=Streptomyces sp. ActVer TaxID=3014558 RepID=UPI0022B56B00|nr:hypothetical protein [Streptomyces sp. ActVer]MCZ4509937.1 hypothetical protein [Streptomyces sp. ActVer]
MGEVTPETVNGLVNAWLWGVEQVDTFGPGVVFVAVFAIAWRALNRAARYVEQIRHRLELGRKLADEQRQMAEHSAALDDAPLIPTRPGHDRQPLDTCNAILRATQTWKETDQP